VYLRDKYLGKETPVAKTGNTDVEFLLDGQAASAAADRFDLVFKTTTVQVAAISGDPTLCVGNTAKMSNATPGGSWSSADATIASIDSAGNVMAKALGTTEIWYTVMKYGNPNTVKQLLTVNNLPAKPTILRDATGQLVSSHTSGNLWYKNNVLQVGATASTFKPVEPGYYRVKAVQNGCEGEMSDTYYYTTGPLLDAVAGTFVRIFPNPVQDEAKIEFMLKDLKTVEVHVYDMKGKRVMEHKGVATGTKINMMALASGVYRFRVLSSKGELLYSYTIVRE
jgi:hypothetical protein